MNEFGSNIEWFLGWNWDIISQVVILLLGGFAVFMTQSSKEEK